MKRLRANIDPERQKQAEEKIVKEKRSEIKWTKIIGIVDLILFVIFLSFCISGDLKLIFWK